VGREVRGKEPTQGVGREEWKGWGGTGEEGVGKGMKLNQGGGSKREGVNGSGDYEARKEWREETKVRGRRKGGREG